MPEFFDTEDTLKIQKDGWNKYSLVFKQILRTYGVKTMLDVSRGTRFDACITIFNAAGCLSKQDLKTTIQNIYDNK